jgi:2-polyprenyl-3-methyl-5-hydroxy-6-metoxy-1,4-benzoquinol methylase
MGTEIVTASLLDRLRRRLSGSHPPASPERMPIDRAAALSASFSAEFPIAEAATDRILKAVAGVDLAALATRSPGLAGFDWDGYLRCSVARVVRVQRVLRERVQPNGQVLDFGSYFGNFALACRASGYRVDAIDAYGEYGAALAPCIALLREAGVGVHDFADAGPGLPQLASRYDAVICAGVIEHIPHTPRLVLRAIHSALRPGGVLVLDTPNLAYLYRRLALVNGDTIFTPIAQQFYTDLPFEGHHREYTTDEVRWMLNASGFDVLAVETFNYSVFAQSALTGVHVAYAREMDADPSLREIILAVGVRTASPTARC